MTGRRYYPSSRAVTLNEQFCAGFRPQWMLDNTYASRVCRIQSEITPEYLEVTGKKFEGIHPPVRAVLVRKVESGISVAAAPIDHRIARRHFDGSAWRLASVLLQEELSDDTGRSKKQFYRVANGPQVDPARLPPLEAQLDGLRALHFPLDGFN